MSYDGSSMTLLPTGGVRALLMMLSQAIALPARHRPLAGSQVSTPLHSSPSSHDGGGSPLVHADACSLQSIVPSHRSRSVHSRSVPDWHLPALQTSLTVQKRPSSHAPAFKAYAHPTNVVHVSSVHGFPSSHCVSLRQLTT